MGDQEVFLQALLLGVHRTHGGVPARVRRIIQLLLIGWLGGGFQAGDCCIAVHGLLV